MRPSDAVTDKVYTFTSGKDTDADEQMMKPIESGILAARKETTITSKTAPHVAQSADTIEFRKDSTDNSQISDVATNLDAAVAFSGNDSPSRGRYVDDVLCSRCRYSLSSTSNNANTCQFWIWQFWKKYIRSQSAGMSNSSSYNSISLNDAANGNSGDHVAAITLVDAARRTAQSKAPFCHRCDPDVCQPHEKRYWYLDAVITGTREDRDHWSPLDAETTRMKTEARRNEITAVTHYLHSISKEHRLPANVVGETADAHERLKLYAAQKENQYPQKRHYFEFNPSIVSIPSGQIPPDDDINLSQLMTPRAVYLASYRVSAAHACIGDHNVSLQLLGGEWLSHQSLPQYLGLALLDAEFNIIREGVFDARSVMRRYEDGRLFRLGDQLYVGSFQWLFPIWLVPPSSNVAAIEDANSTVATDPARVSRRANNDDIIELQHVFPEILDEANGIAPKDPFTVFFAKRGYCSKDNQIRRTGKNLNYFVDDENQVVMESQPMGPKEIIDVQPQREDEGNVTNSGSYFITSNFSIPAPSFATTDELELARQNLTSLPPYTGERGGACCVRFQYNNRQLLLGISHSKTRFRHNRSSKDREKGMGGIESNQFFSRFYAMEPRAPYRVVAQSGKWCLGFPRSDEPGGNPFVNIPYTPFGLVPKVMIVPVFTLSAE